MTVNFDARPWLILCEGESDKRFLDHLIEGRNIPNEYQVKFPDRAGGAGGRSKFGWWLDLQKTTSETFRRNIKAVLIISDNDQAPAASFQEVRTSLVDDGNGFPVPATERIVAREPGYPDLVVFMIPTGLPGNLETLCLEAAYDKWPEVKKPLDIFTGSLPAKGWHIGKQSKMRMQTVIAATCEDRPDAGFVGHWRERLQFHVPVNHAAFNDIEIFLRGFGPLLATP